MPKHFSAENCGVGAGPALARSGNATTAAKAAAASERDLLSNSMTYSFRWVEVGREGVLVVAPPADARTPAERSVMPALWRSHIDGLEVHGGFDAEAVEMRVEPLLCPLVAGVTQIGEEFPVGLKFARDAELRYHVVGRDTVDPHAPERPIDDGAVIDQPCDEADRPHLAQQ